MRVALAFGLLCLAASLPMTVGRWLLRFAQPRVVIIFGWLALTAIAVGSVIVLGASVETSASPISDLPGLVDRCIGAVSQIWQHPVKHWPRIGASILFLAAIARVIYAVATTIVGAHREAARALSLAMGNTVEGAPNLAIVRSDRPFAFVAGIWHRRIVISDGLMSSLGPRALRAVIAHEAAHVLWWHAASLLLARTAARAFPFIPAVKEAADQLVLGLEMHADAAAVKQTHDPLVVAQTLLAVAERSTAGAWAGLSVTGGSLAMRIERLTVPPRIGGGVRSGPVVALGAMTILLCSLIVLLPTSALSLASSQRAAALHDACHLPHPVQIGTV